VTRTAVSHRFVFVFIRVTLCYSVVFAMVPCPSVCP